MVRGSSNATRAGSARARHTRNVRCRARKGGRMSGFGDSGPFGRHDPRNHRDPYPGEAIFNSDAHFGVLKRSGAGLALREIVARFIDEASAQAFAETQTEEGAVFS